MNIAPKILIVSANKLTTPYPVYPLGLAYLSTYLKEKLPDCHIHMFDFNLNSTADFIKELNSFNPKYIAVSIRNIDGVNSYDPVNFIGLAGEQGGAFQRIGQGFHRAVLGLLGRQGHRAVTATVQYEEQAVSAFFGQRIGKKAAISDENTKGGWFHGYLLCE